MHCVVWRVLLVCYYFRSVLSVAVCRMLFAACSSELCVGVACSSSGVRCRWLLVVVDVCCLLLTCFFLFFFSLFVARCC